MIGRVVQPSGISLRASIRPLESEVIASGNRLTGVLDLRLGGAVVEGPTPGTVDVAPIGFVAGGGEVVVVVVAAAVVVVAAAVAAAGADAIVVDVARLSREEVAGAASLGVIAANDTAVPTVPVITTNTSDRRCRSLRQAMAVPGSILEEVRWTARPNSKT